MTIEVVAPGPFTTVQDLGRPGLAALGVGRSGAADRRSLRLANRLAGNEEGAAALELTFGGLRARFSRLARVALAGAPCEATAGGRPLAMHAAEWVRAGEELRIGPPATGVRTYLAVGGGIDVPPVLGSRATDTLAHLGPHPLGRGDVLELGAPPAAEPEDASGSHAGGSPPAAEVAPVPELDGAPVLRLVPGPREDWFTAAALEALVGEAWTVTPDSNRVGLRLDGPPLERARDDELPPEGMVEGALQVPPDGRPVLFLSDHPVTGGYPVIAVVATDDVALAAQARPGAVLRFRR